MILTTTPTIEGHPIREYRGVVTGESIIGANIVKDFLAGIRDFIGGRSSSYERAARSQGHGTARDERARRSTGLQRHRRHRPRLRDRGQQRKYADGDMQRYGRCLVIYRTQMSLSTKNLAPFRENHYLCTNYQPSTPIILLYSI